MYYNKSILKKGVFIMTKVNENGQLEFIFEEELDLLSKTLIVLEEKYYQCECEIFESLENKNFQRRKFFENMLKIYSSSIKHVKCSIDLFTKEKGGF
jgi:hypothetical protein